MIAKLAVMPPEDVRWTHEPVFVRHIDPGCIPAVGQQAGPANQRWVMEVYDVKPAVIEDLVKAASIYRRAPRLLRDDN